MERGAAHVLSQHPSWPSVRADLSTAPSHGVDSLIWAPWAPGDPLGPVAPPLMEGLDRVARLTKAILREEDTGTTGLFLAGHWPLQDGTLSPMAIGSVGGVALFSSFLHRDPRRKAFFQDALGALGRAGLTDTLARRPWLHTPSVQAVRVLLPPTAPSAHQTLEDLRWANAHGWAPKAIA